MSDCVPYEIPLSEWRSNGAPSALRCACTWVPEKRGATFVFNWRPWDTPNPIPPSVASMLPRAGSKRVFRTGGNMWFVSAESGEFGGAAYVVDERAHELVEVRGLRCGAIAQAGSTIYCTTLSAQEGAPESIVEIDASAARVETVRILQLPRAADALALDPMRPTCFFVLMDGSLLRECRDGQVSTVATGLGPASGVTSMVVDANGDVLIASPLGVTRIAREGALVERLHPPKAARCEHVIY